MDAARRLQRCLDRLAAGGGRWAALAASPALGELVESPAARLRAFAPDPLADLTRPGAAAAAEIDSSGDATRQPAAMPRRLAQLQPQPQRLWMPALHPPAAPAVTNTAAAVAAEHVPMPAPLRYRIAESTTRRLVLRHFPDAPPALAPSPPAASWLPAAPVPVPRHWAAASTAPPTVDAARLRAMAWAAEPRAAASPVAKAAERVPASAPTAQRASALLPRPAASVAAPAVGEP